MCPGFWMAIGVIAVVGGRALPVLEQDNCVASRRRQVNAATPTAVAASAPRLEYVPITC